MSGSATQLLATFQSLSPEERHDVMVLLLRESGELPDTYVSDDQLVAIADELFEALDVEESNGNAAEER